MPVFGVHPPQETQPSSAAGVGQPSSTAGMGHPSVSSGWVRASSVLHVVSSADPVPGPGEAGPGAPQAMGCPSLLFVSRPSSLSVSLSPTHSAIWALLPSRAAAIAAVGAARGAAATAATGATIGAGTFAIARGAGAYT